MVSVQAWIRNAVNLATQNNRAASFEQVFTVVSLILYFDAIFGVVFGGASEILTRLPFLASYAIVTGLLLTRYRDRLQALLPRGGLLWVVALFPVLSVLWSDHPALTFWGGFSVLQASLFGVYLGLRFSLSALLRLLAYTLMVLLGLSLLFTIGFWVAGYTGSAAIRGVFADADAFGLRMVLGAIVFLLLALEAKAGRRRAGWALFAVSIVCVFLSGSSSARECALVIVAAIPSIAIPRWRIGRKANILLYAIAFLFGSTLFALAENASSLLGLFKLDAPLSGTVAADPEVIAAIKHQFLIGYGYQSFWAGSLDSPSESLSQLAISASDTHLHSGILESMLNVGFIGTLCAFVCLWSATLNFSRLIRTRQSPVYFFPILFFCLFLFSNFSEHSLYAHSNIFWVLFLSVLTMAATRSSRILLQEKRYVNEPSLTDDSLRSLAMPIAPNPQEASSSTNKQSGDQPATVLGQTELNRSDLGLTVPIFRGFGTSSPDSLTAGTADTVSPSTSNDLDLLPNRDSLVGLPDRESVGEPLADAIESNETDTGDDSVQFSGDSEFITTPPELPISEPSDSTENSLSSSDSPSSSDNPSTDENLSTSIAAPQESLTDLEASDDEGASADISDSQDSVELAEMEEGADTTPSVEDEDTAPSQASMSNDVAAEEADATLSLPKDAYASLVTAYLSAEETNSESLSESDILALDEMNDVFESQSNLEKADPEDTQLELAAVGDITASDGDPDLNSVFIDPVSEVDTDIDLDPTSDGSSISDLERDTEVISHLDATSTLESNSELKRLSEADTEPNIEPPPDLALWSDLVSEVVEQPTIDPAALSSDVAAFGSSDLQTGEGVRDLLLAAHWLNTLDPDWIGLEEESFGQEGFQVGAGQQAQSDSTATDSSTSGPSESNDRSKPTLAIPTLLVNESLLKIHDLKFEVDASAPIFRRLEAAELMSAAQLASVQSLWQQEGGPIAIILQQETGLGMRTINFFSDSLWSRHLEARKRIGEYLQDAELVTARQVQTTLNSLQQEQRLMPLGVALAEQGLIRQTTADYFARSLVQRAKSPYQPEVPLTSPFPAPKNIELAETKGGCTVCVVTLWGRLGRRPHKQLRQELFDAAEQFSPNLLLDMSLVTSVDILALGAIVAAANRCRSMRGQLCLAGLTTDVQMYLRNQGMQLGLKSFPNRRIAIEYFPIL